MAIRNSISVSYGHIAISGCWSTSKSVLELAAMVDHAGFVVCGLKTQGLLLENTFIFFCN